ACISVHQKEVLRLSKCVTKPRYKRLSHWDVCGIQPVFNAVGLQAVRQTREPAAVQPGVRNEQHSSPQIATPNNVSVKSASETWSEPKSAEPRTTAFITCFSFEREVIIQLSCGQNLCRADVSWVGLASDKNRGGSTLNAHGRQSR